MLNIAIVEDDVKSASLIEDYLRRYSDEYGDIFDVKKYENAVNFLNNYKPVFNIIFMDIELPGLSGMEASIKLRMLDNLVTLIFVTNMAQFAINGYEVNALDFIVKPVSYPNFAMKLCKAIKVEKGKLKEQKVLTLYTAVGTKIVTIREIKYIEVNKHRVVFHTEKGITEIQGSLKEFEKLLFSMNFSRCHNCYLVNLKYVTEIQDDAVVLDGEKLQMSRRKKQDFVDDFTKYIGGL